MDSVLLLVTLFWVQVLGAMLPGPDMLIVMRNSLLYGRLRGMLTACGVATFLTTYCAIAVFTIATIQKSHMTAFKTVACIGALYLFYLAYKCFKSAKAYSFKDKFNATGSADISLVKAYFLGLFTNMSNPKVIVYFLSVMPFFLARGTTLPMHLGMIAAAGLACLSWFLFVANVMSIQKVRNKFAKWAVYMEYVFSVVLFVFGLSVLIENLVM